MKGPWNRKKREFNMITADLYSLVRAIKYDGNVIYYMSCATAFADSNRRRLVEQNN
ncbi:MAG: hypothetical protein WDM78_24150 [Puia sp.]